jgi:DNA repair protein RecN (Recombination protein N)
MLKRLTIEQFVIIDRLELDFKPGLTVLTGETGAGKSILLDAMGQILGEASAPEAIRAGSTEAKLSATFAPPSDNPVWKFLRDNNLADPAQGEFTIYRTVVLVGEDEIKIGEKPVSVDLLNKLGTYLVEIHGQFANQSLLDPDNQLKLLDLSGAFPPEIFDNVRNALHDVRRYTQELQEENDFLANHKREAPKIEEVVRQFEKLGMKTGFIEETKKKYDRLLTAKVTSEAFQDILAQLIAANGVVMTLSSANNILTRNKNLDTNKMATLSEHLTTSLEHARAAVTEMRRIAPEYDIDTAPIYALEDILGGLQKISKEHKIKFDDLAEYYEVQSTKLNRIKGGREKIAELQDLLIKSKNTYRHHAHILTEKRTAAGLVLSQAITAELAPLKLARAEFSVKVEEQANMPWTELGLNKVTFTARMNPGQPFSPVSETASGGELARLILALKVVLQKVQTTTTLVFDEVDTGIGGAAAAAVGERIAQLADKTQVLVITHSPQVASRNDQHLHVAKQSDGITTTSSVRMLPVNESIDEISRMLAGDVITPESHAAAKSLVDEAKAAAEIRRKNNVQQPVQAPLQS